MRLGPRIGLMRRLAETPFRGDWLILLGLLVLAAAARFPGLAGRGDFDADQGHDMLTLMRFVMDGQIPLLGPPTSIGDFHHGAAYYFLLAPLAWLGGGDPVVVMAGIAALGTAAVGVTWWLARAIGGRWTGLIAGLLMAVSPAAIEESTFIWNPNPIPFFAVLSLAAAWRARVTGRARWWTLAVASAGMVIQLHVLGVVFLPPVLAFGAFEAGRAYRAGDRRRVRSIVTGVSSGLILIAVMFVPLLIHELQTGFLETRHMLAYLAAPSGGTSASHLDPIGRLIFTVLRVIGWPLAGLVTSAPLAAILIVSIVLVLVGWLMVVGRGPRGCAVRWLGLTLAWGAITLSVLAPSLQTVVPGLPNDHYHAFLDPVVIILAALSVGTLGSAVGAQVKVGRVARLVASGAVIALVLFDIGRWPPLTQANGGWPLARDAGARIVASVPGRFLDVRSLPVFKSAEGIGFPIVVAGGNARIATGLATQGGASIAGAALVIVCDRLFEHVIGAPCGGPAEARYLAALAVADGQADAWHLVDRFDASARTSISTYLSTH